MVKLGAVGETLLRESTSVPYYRIPGGFQTEFFRFNSRSRWGGGGQHFSHTPTLLLSICSHCRLVFRLLVTPAVRIVASTNPLSPVCRSGVVLRRSLCLIDVERSHSEGSAAWPNGFGNQRHYHC